MSPKNPNEIPYYVEPPSLSPATIDEITLITFGEPIEPEPCDIIFVFGGSHPGLWEVAAEAYFKELGEDIIVTGGHKPGAFRHFPWMDGKTPESGVIRQKLIQLGVPEAHIFIETKSTNTYENVRFALEVYNFSTVTRILAVCKSYAIGRQIRTLKAHLPSEISVIPYPFDSYLGADGPFITRHNWMEYPEGRAYMFANLLKIHQYGLLGHLLPVENLSKELEAIISRYLNHRCT